MVLSMGVQLKQDIYCLGCSLGINIKKKRLMYRM